MSSPTETMCESGKLAVRTDTFEFSQKVKKKNHEKGVSVRVDTLATILSTATGREYNW